LLLASGGAAALRRMLNALHPVSPAAPLATLVLLLGFRGQQILAQPLVIQIARRRLPRWIRYGGSPTPRCPMPPAARCQTNQWASRGDGGGAAR
jgi:hypothetical protein